jgi:curved DNA-binding protein CbpA
MPEKLYEILGVSEDASQADIEKAYREKVKESHPDLSDDPDAGDQFQLVLTAKEVLTDDDERELYEDLGHKTYMDMFGDDAGEDSSGGGSSPSGSASSGADRSASTSGRSSSTSAESDGSSGSTDAGGSPASGADASGSPRNRSSSGSRTASSSSTGSASSSSSPSASSSSRSGGSSSSSGSGSSEPEPPGSAGSASSSGGDGGARAASGGVSQRTVAQEAERTRKEWQAAARRGETSGSDGPWSTSSSQGDHLAAGRVDTGIATKIRSRDVVEMTVVMLVAYPIFVFATVWPDFHLAVNAFIGLVTVAVVVYTLTEPLVSLVVFGTWSVLAPLLLVFVGIDVLGFLAVLFALTVTWVPFILAFLLTLAMPNT